MGHGLLRFAEVSLGSGGLPTCARCETASVPAPRAAEDVIAEALSAIESWDRALLGPGPNVALVGAEPFAHPSLPEIVFTLVEAGASRLRLRTGAEALIVAENAEGVLRAGVRHLEVVVLGPHEVHDALTARPDAFESARRGMRAFLDTAGESGIDAVLSGRIRVCRHNLEHAPAAVAVLAEVGALEIVLQVSDTASKTVGAATWIASACDTGVVNGVWVSVECAAALPGVADLHFVAATSSAAGASGPERATAREGESLA